MTQLFGYGLDKTALSEMHAFDSSFQRKGENLYGRCTCTFWLLFVPFRVTIMKCVSA